MMTPWKKQWRIWPLFAALLALFGAPQAAAREPVTITAGAKPRKPAPIQATRASAARFELDLVAPAPPSGLKPPSVVGSGERSRRPEPPKSGAGGEKKSRVVTSGLVRRTYGSLYDKVARDLGKNPPLVMSAEDFQRAQPVLDKLANAPKPAPASPRSAVNVKLDGQHLLLEFGSDRHTEVIPIELPVSKAGDAGHRAILEQALKDLPATLQLAHDRIEKVLWREKNYVAVAGGQEFPLGPVPPSESRRARPADARVAAK